MKKQKLTPSEEPAFIPNNNTPVVLPERGERGENDAYTLYLREIGQTKLLTGEEEHALALRVQKGDKKAREEMIKANLRLVVKIARDYEGNGLPLLDLINEGNIGLMKGVERFDPHRGAKISTYCSWWIKQSVKRALANQSKTIRLPVHIVDKVAHMRRTATKLHEMLGREPTDEELADEVGFSVANVARYRTAALNAISLDASLGDDDSSRVGDLIEDEKAQTPYQELQGRTDVKLIRDLLPTLDPREAEILRQRFGLDGGKERTLEEIGGKFGVTRERIRQLQNSAMQKLRKKIAALEATQLAA